MGVLRPIPEVFGTPFSERITRAPMKIEVERIGNDAVIRLSGRLDINTSPDLRKAALTLCTKRRYRNLTIDFRDVSFIDTSGLATLLEIVVAARDQSMQLILTGVGQKVRYLIDVNGLTDFFRIESSEREKLHA
jgi:anti-sigma B factor antagonist